ncbi:hypothetical protein V7S43_018307 [Phytophthora oleae]|uniref:Uncharacterized protein n=1 Tax=Phytophthora oleae TaxID=2107226 RepID=A0ABD3EQP4_9STRA
MAAALAVDCIPLRPPSDGWEANYLLWIRVFITMFIVSIGLALQVHGLVTRNSISNIAALGISIGSAATYVAVSITSAALIKFPIPFGYVLMVGPYISIFAVFTVFTIGFPVLANSPELRTQLLSQGMIIATQGLVAVAYPIFSAVFIRLTGIQQTIFVLVMPMIKFITKQIIARTVTRIHEYVGPIVVLSVDVFNVYYIAICMQATTSMLTTAIIIVSDSFHVFLALRDIFRQKKVKNPNQDGRSVCAKTTNYLTDLKVSIESGFKASQTSAGLARRVRILSPFPLQLSVQSKALLDGLKPGKLQPSSLNQLSWRSVQSFPVEDSPSEAAIETHHNLAKVPTKVIAKRQVSPAHWITRARTKVFDINSFGWKSKRTLAPSAAMVAKALNHEAQETVVVSLRTLFHSEYVLLAEYIEFILPMLYSLYLAALYHLPVAAYYPHTASMTDAKLKATVVSIFIFSVIEFAAFVGLLVLLKRKFGYSPLHQLAFVLEMQFCTVQGHLIVWNFYILHLTLAHYGVDFNAPFQ